MTKVSEDGEYSNLAPRVSRTCHAPAMHLMSLRLSPCPSTPISQLRHRPHSPMRSCSHQHHTTSFVTPPPHSPLLLVFCVLLLLPPNHQPPTTNHQLLGTRAWPQFSPSGDRLAFLRAHADGPHRRASAVTVYSFADGSTTTVTPTPRTCVCMSVCMSV